MTPHRFPAWRRPPTKTDDDVETAQPTAPRLHVVGDDVYPDWESIYRDNMRRVYQLMFRKVGNRPDAEDLTEEVFLAALRPLRVSASVGEVRAYLLTVAKTVLANHWRRTLGRQITTLDDDQAATFVSQLPGPSTTGQVEAILAALPDRYRHILELRFLRSYSLKDTAAELGVSVGNAKVLQHRALRRAAAVAERMKP